MVNCLAAHNLLVYGAMSVLDNDRHLAHVRPTVLHPFLGPLPLLPHLLRIDVKQKSCQGQVSLENGLLDLASLP